MHLLRFFLLVASFIHLAFAADVNDINVLQKHKGVLDVAHAKNIVEQLWSQSWRNRQHPSDVQKLASGFEQLIKQLKNDEQKSTAEQAYLMWLSGRTHGVDKTNKSDADWASQIRTRDLITYGIAQRTCDSAKLNSTQKAIEKLLAESSNCRMDGDDLKFFMRYQDYGLFASIKKNIGLVWLQKEAIADDKAANVLEPVWKVSSTICQASFLPWQCGQNFQLSR